MTAKKDKNEARDTAVQIQDNQRSSLLKELFDLLVCVVGIYGCYIGFGIYQEKLFVTPRGMEGVRFTHSLFMTWCLACVNGCAGFIGCLFTRQSPFQDVVPKHQYFQIAVSYVGAMFASNAALNFVDYPTQALGKSVKIIPVMLMRSVLGGKKYRLREYLTVLLITAGIAVFMMAKVKTKKSAAVDEEGSPFTYFIGVGLLCVSLVLDGFTGPKQENILAEAKRKPSMSQMMFWLNTCSVLLVGIVLVVTGAGVDAVAFISAYPEVLVEMIIAGVLSAVGQNFILHTVFRFNSLVLTIITTTRKFFTLLSSVLLYGHQLKQQQYVGVALVFTGLSIDMFYKYQAKMAPPKEKAGSNASVPAQINSTKPHDN